MERAKYAKLFRIGAYQAVRLPREFQFQGTRVRIRRVPEGVLLQPVFDSVKEWFAAMDRYRDIHFMEDGRKQPPPQKRKLFD